MTKTEGRIYALNLRKSFNSKDISKKIVNKLINLDILKDYKHIGIYYPINNEIDITSLLDIYSDKMFYLPVTKDVLEFYPYHKEDILLKKKFNLLEPKETTIVSKEDIEAFIVPSVCINKNGQRIGYGKGYYDKYLADYKGIKIAVIYKELNNLDILCNDYDLKFDFIIEE